MMKDEAFLRKIRLVLEVVEPWIITPDSDIWETAVQDSILKHMSHMSPFKEEDNIFFEYLFLIFNGKPYENILSDLVYTSCIEDDNLLEWKQTYNKLKVHHNRKTFKEFQKIYDSL